MKYLEIPDMQNGYVELVDWVVHQGKIVAPRGYKTLEIEDAVFTVKDPSNCLPIHVGRDPLAAIMAAEALLLVGGIHSPSLLTNVSDNFRRFLDGGDLHGGYGRRIRGQMQDAYETLVRDRDTRQAVVQIWDPAYDSGAQVNDLPCTLGFNFRIRNGGLHMSTTMRSNDVWLGTCYDVGMFCQLGWSLANALGVELTEYTHHAYSLHVYERNLDATGKLQFTSEPGVDLRGFGEPHGSPQTYRHVQMMAQDIYDRTVEPGTVLTPTERWFVDTLEPYDRLVKRSNFSS